MDKVDEQERQHDSVALQQYFPTYRFSDPEVALRDFEAALRSYESEERVFLNAVQITLVVGAGLGSLLLSGIDSVVLKLGEIFPPLAVVAHLTVLACIFSYTTLRYFAERQKAIVFAARKVIVLRRMLGLSYGTQQLVLPNWRIEGADEPFVVRMFPGWNTYVAYPFWILGGFSFTIVVLLGGIGLQYTRVDQFLYWPRAYFALLLGLVWFLGLANSYRKALADIHGSGRQLLALRVAAALRVKLVGNFEQVIYRARLAVFEHKRLGIDLPAAFDFALYVEDRRFYHHKGVSFRAIVRAAWGFIRRGRKSGGSTITQQVARTLFVIDYTKTYRRKVIETFLARYLEGILSKTEILKWYLVSVRFETKALGLAAAMKHFFGRVPKSPTRAELFFLIERLGNSRSRVLCARIEELARGALTENILEHSDMPELARIYREQVEKHHIVVRDKLAFERLLSALDDLGKRRSPDY